MIFISHRGNLAGPNPNEENHPEKIQYVLDKGFDVEIDVWLKENGEFYLGHDGPEFPIDLHFLKKQRLWLHAKTTKTYDKLVQSMVTHVFMHDREDSVSVTSGERWTYPGRMQVQMAPYSIYVMPELVFARADLFQSVMNCRGVCSDYVEEIKEAYQLFVQ